MKMSGGLSIVGIVMGGHFLADIKVSVPQGVVVFITAEQALQSRDLHRAMQQGLVMKLDGGTMWANPTQFTPAAVVAPPPVSDNRLESENSELRRELAESKAREAGLHATLASLSGQIEAFTKMLERLEPRASSLGAVSIGSPSPRIAPQGPEAPVFIPSQITPNVDSTSIQVQTSESEDTESLTDARAKLRALRNK